MISRSAALLVALLLAAGSSARAQVDTSGVKPDSAARDSTRDTLPHYLAVLPAPIPAGPLPAGSRYTFTADSLAFSDTRTLSDLLARIPGVFVARGGLYGQAEPVLFGGRGPRSLEIYWDGVPYLPLGRDSVYLDPARIALAPLERVDVVVLPATLRVYLVTARQRSTAPASEVGITTGVLNTAEYRGAFLKRWRSGLGLSLVADWNDVNGIQNTASTAFHDVDLWVQASYVPGTRFGASWQIASTDWNRSANTDPQVDEFRTKRVTNLARVFVATRADGLGSRVDLTLATTSQGNDAAVADRTLNQGVLELSSLWRRASVALIGRVGGDPNPWQVEAQAGWKPLAPLTVSGDARHAAYAYGRSGDRAHVGVGLELPWGFSAHGDLEWADDLAAPARQDDAPQRTSDLAGAFGWHSRWLTFQVGGARRDAFTAPLVFPAGILSVSGLAPTPATNYFSLQASLRPLPGLELAGWYFDPVRGGADFEPPTHTRYSVIFYSKFWRTYRSGIFAFRAEAGAESWSGGSGAGVFADSTGATTPLTLPGATLIDFNMQVRIAGVTLFWAIRNARVSHQGYVPGLAYPGNYQLYGVRWLFTN